MKAPKEVRVPFAQVIDFLVARYRIALKDDLAFIRSELFAQSGGMVTVKVDETTSEVILPPSTTLTNGELKIGENPLSAKLYDLVGNTVWLISGDTQKAAKVVCDDIATNKYRLILKGNMTVPFHLDEVESIDGDATRGYLLTLRSMETIQSDQDLTDARRIVANDCLAEFKCEGFIHADGWIIMGDVFSCTYYVEKPTDPDGPSVQRTFGVKFVPDTTEVNELWQ